MAKEFIIAGNWKMNAPDVRDFTYALHGYTGTPKGVTIIIAPPATHIAPLRNAIGDMPFFVSGQDVSEHESGAYTGEVSAAMLLEAGAVYAIIGHSERRQYHNETDEIILNKVKTAIQYGIRPILCVGEKLSERRSGKAASVVQTQTEYVYSGIGAADRSSIITAYEPVWAIGTGMTASAEDAEEMCGMIYNTTGGAVLYGGSMNERNAESLLVKEHISGGLIGGASLKPDTFAAIINSAVKLAI